MNATLEWSIIVPAFVAGLLVLATHVPLGVQVLQRGIVFIDLAIAQIAALGVIVAGLFAPEPGYWLVQVAAGGAALLGALLLTWTERRWPDVQEAQIGVLFVLAATGGLLLLAHNPHGGEHLRDLLVGQILWVGPAQLIAPVVVTLLVGGLWWWRRASLTRTGFYLLFALAVTVSVQVVGVYLVFASLIVPALGARHYAPRWRLPCGWAIGAGGYAAGLLLSTWYDLPTGALIVWCIAALAVLAQVLGPAAPKKA